MVKTAESGVRYDSPWFNIQWPLPVTELSERDKMLPENWCKQPRELNNNEFKNVDIVVSHLTFEVINLGHQPPSNAYLTGLDLKKPELSYPLKVYACTSCWLVQVPEYTCR